MLRHFNITLHGKLLLASMFMMLAASQTLLGEESVWVRCYGAPAVKCYPTDGFGSYYVPKSVAANMRKLQTDPIKKPAESKADATKATDNKPVDSVAETPAPKPAQSTQKSFWKRLTFRK